MGRRTLLLITSILVAAVGTALIGLYVRGADSRAVGNATTRSVLVAAATIPNGASLGTESYTQRDLRVGDLPKDAITDPTQIKGVALSKILPGQILQKQMFGTTSAAASSGIGEGQLGITVELSDPERAAGLLKVNSKIEIFTIPNGGTKKKSVPLLGDNGTGVTVIQIGNQRVGSSSTAAANGTAAENVPSTLVGLSLNQADVIKIKDAEANGTLYFAVLPAAKS
jgi:pilus assembly protein CpaB